MKSALLCILAIWIGMGVAGSVPAHAQQATPPSVMPAVYAKGASLRTLRADIETVTERGGEKTTSSGKLALMKPNFLSLRISKGETSSFMSDGKTVFVVTPSLKACVVSPADPRGQRLLPGMVAQILFFDPEALRTRLWKEAPVTDLGIEKFRNLPYRKLKIGPSQNRRNMTTFLYIGSDNLVHRQVSIMQPPKGNPNRTEFLLTHIDTASKMTPKDFAYHPPAHLRVVKQSDLNKNAGSGKTKE